MKVRRDRVAEEVRDAVATAIAAMKDPRLGFVSVLRVEMSPDLSHATVYVSRYGDKAAVSASEAALSAATGYVRTSVGKAVRLRHTPEIHWTFDDSLVYSQRIDSILRDIRKGDES